VTYRLQILLPTFNASRWFERALASVAGQPDSQVLVLDDGSEASEAAAVEEICRRYPNARFIPGPHRGLSRTLNEGLSIATAPYVARMDADDISQPARLAAQIAFLDAHPDVGVVGAQLAYIDEEERPLASPKMHPLRHEEIRAQLLAGHCVVMHPTVMMRRECVLAAGGYRPALDSAEDIDLWLRLAGRTRLANLPERLLLYRLHDGQVSRTKTWQQRLAQDLALLSARRIRQGRPDPVDDLEALPDLRSGDLTGDAEVDTLIEAYRFAAAAGVEQGKWGSADAVLTAVRDRSLHCGAKPASKMVVLVLRDAIANGRMDRVMKAILTGLTYRPLYFARFSIRRWRGLD